MKERILFAQKKLKEAGLKPGPIDGVLGSKTLATLAKVKGIPEEFSSKRKLIAYIQILCNEKKLKAGPVDGYWGPQTLQAYEAYRTLDEVGGTIPVWRPEDIPNKNPNDWPMQTQAELEKFYGKVGTNQVYIQLPYTHRLSWNKSQKVTRLKCHEKVHYSLHKVLTEVLKHYGESEIRRLGLDITGGCLNVRKMRGGTKWSTHSWGIALDYDPQNNQLKWGRDKATFAQQDYEAWWKIWESEGWVSLGRQRNFDWMHVQAAKIN